MAGYDSDLVYVDGPRFYEWLHKVMGFDVMTELKALKPNTERRLREYKNGNPAHIDAVDRIMVALGSHISLIPDDYWIPKPKAKTPVIVTEAERIRAVERVRNGERQCDVARELGVRDRTVMNWVRLIDGNGERTKRISSISSE